MNKIGSSSFVKDEINRNDIKVKKYYGQNFLVDQNILGNIVAKALLSKDVNVIEIGPGLGSLTEHLCSVANKVLCYEIDKDLLPILDKNLSDFNNYKIINQDILKSNVEEDAKEYFDDKPVYLVANLPYYITTPIILGLLEQTTLIKRYVVMIQNEVADRICSKPNVKDYNALSLAIQYRASTTKVLDVSRNCFYPAPNVDSAVIRIDLYDNPPYRALNEDLFFKLIRLAFSQRRKTLANNLSLKFEKDVIGKLFSKLNLEANVRSEQLSLETFVNMANCLSQEMDLSI